VQNLTKPKVEYFAVRGEVVEGESATVCLAREHTHPGLQGRWGWFQTTRVVAAVERIFETENTVYVPKPSAEYLQFLKETEDECV
jgi:hypothetical protein